MKKQNRRTPAPVRFQDETIVYSKAQLRREMKRARALMRYALDRFEYTVSTLKDFVLGRAQKLENP